MFGVDDPRHASPELQHAADSKWCVRCGTPYVYAAAYMGHLGDYRCPACGHARPALDVVAREIELNGLESVSFELVTPEGSTSRRAGRAGALQRLQRARGRGAHAGPRGRAGWTSSAGLQGFSAAFGRFERIEIGDSTLLMLLIKNPAGANEVVRTLVAGGAPQPASRRAERRDRGRPRRLLDLGRRLRALARRPRAAGRDRRAGGRAGAALQVRRPPGELDRREAVARGCARPRARADTARLRSSSRCPPTRRCWRCATSWRGAGLRGPTGRRRREDRRRAPVPRLPEHLRGSRQHRGSRAPCGLARARARRAVARRGRRRCCRASTTSTTSAAARTASRS